MSRLVYILILILGVSCRNEIGEAMKGEGTSLEPIQTTYNAEIKYSNNGITTSKLISPRIDRFWTKDTSYIIMKQGFKAIFFDSLGVQESTLTAKMGTWFEEKKIMVAEKNVTFENKKGEKLYTHRLTWLQDSSIITTDQPIKIVRNDGVIYGKGLVAAEDFSSYSINQITGELFVEDNDSTFTAKDSLP